MTDPIETIRILVDDVNAARAELAKALGPSERSLASGVALLANAYSVLKNAYSVLKEEAQPLRAEVAELKRQLLETQQHRYRIMTERDALGRERDEARQEVRTLSLDRTPLCAEIDGLRAEVDRLKRELAEATKKPWRMQECSICGHVSFRCDPLPCTACEVERLKAELDAIKAPQCLTEKEALDTWDNHHGIKASCAAVARAAERKLVGALLGAADEEASETVRMLLFAIGAPAEPAKPEPASAVPWPPRRIVLSLHVLNEWQDAVEKRIERLEAEPAKSEPASAVLSDEELDSFPW